MLLNSGVKINLSDVHCFSVHQWFLTTFGLRIPFLFYCTALYPHNSIFCTKERSSLYHFNHTMPALAFLLFISFRTGVLSHIWILMLLMGWIQTGTGWLLWPLWQYWQGVQRQQGAS